MNKKIFNLVFQVCIFIAMIHSFYVLIKNCRNTNISINCWQFPMLLAIFIESIIYKH